MGSKEVFRIRDRRFAEDKARPLIGVLCCNESLDRPVQTVASRFVAPLAHISGAIVLLVPAIPDALDASGLTDRLDGLLLTGSRSNVAVARYGRGADEGEIDIARDEVAMTLAARMIERGRPVFGVCRGLQEINVLFGGTLAPTPTHRLDDDLALDFSARFAHRHAVTLVDGGLLAETVGRCRLEVNSVHGQGIETLGAGLRWEALADDGLVEAVSARPNDADVLGVQWHPEWDVAHAPASRAFFTLIGESMRGAVLAAA